MQSDMQIAVRFLETGTYLFASLDVVSVNEGGYGWVQIAGLVPYDDMYLGEFVQLFVNLQHITHERSEDVITHTLVLKLGAEIS